MEGEQPDPLKTKTVSWLLITEPNWDDPPSNVPLPPEIAGRMIRVYENPMVSLKAGQWNPLFLRGVRWWGW